MVQSRYIAIADKPASPAKSSYYDGGVGMILMDSSCTVMVEEKCPEYTGLRDAEGRRLYRMPETVPIGFHLR
jgi:hypothetical protein